MMMKIPNIDKSLIADFLTAHAASENFSNSARQIYMMQRGQAPQLISWYKQNQNIKAAVDRLNFYGNAEYYTTKNSFYADKRAESSLFSLDNLVVDLDAHDRRLSDSEYKYNCDKLLYNIAENSDNIPYPDAVRSGRGLHLWYSHESLSAKIKPIYSIYGGIIADRVNKLCREIESPFTVDTTATTNTVGLIRLPGTINLSVGRIATLDTLTPHRYTIDELKGIIDIEGNILATTQPSKACSLSNENARTAYTPLNRKRIRFLESIVDSDPYQTGRRESLLFVYMNAVYQLSGNAEYTMQQGRLYNAKYTEPLSNSELNCIHKGITTNTNKLHTDGYNIPEKRFFEITNATFEEIFMYRNMMSNKEYQRAEKRQLKAERDAKILFLHSQGYSQREIAVQVGCDVATVCRKLKKSII